MVSAIGARPDGHNIRTYGLESLEFLPSVFMMNSI
jgi:hypothetical protein